MSRASSSFLQSCTGGGPDEYSVNELQILKGGDVMPEDDRSSRSVRMCYVIIVVIFLLNNDTIPLASLRYRYTISNS